MSLLTQLSTGNGEVFRQDCPFLDDLGSGGGLRVSFDDSSCNGFVDFGVLIVRDISHKFGLAADWFAPIQRWFGELFQRFHRVKIYFGLWNNYKELIVNEYFQWSVVSYWIFLGFGVRINQCLLHIDDIYLHRQEYWQELSLVSDEHAVTDTGQMFADFVFNWNRRNIFTSGSYEEFCNQFIYYNSFCIFDACGRLLSNLI